MSDTHGAATAASTWLTAMAPMKAPTVPGMASMNTARQWTFPKRQCAVPDMMPVPIFATWMVAEATAGENPIVARSVAEVTP